MAPARRPPMAPASTLPAPSKMGFGASRRPASTPPTTTKRSLSAPKKPSKHMDIDPVEYWNAQARDYDGNIFSTIDEDKFGVIMSTIDRFAQAKGDGAPTRCVDLGCGAGKYLPALSARFSSVTAYDLSPKLVGLACKEVKRRGLTNVNVNVRDLSQVWFRASGEGGADAEDLGSMDEMGSYGFAVMANVLIAPVTEGVRSMMLRNALRALCPGGRLLAVVPSLESALFVNMRCDEVNYDGPYTNTKKGGNPQCEDGDVAQWKPTRAEGADILKGVLRRSGVRTKHFLEPEFRLLATRMGFKVESCEKIQYAWHSELGLEAEALAPRGLREPPLPWDWLFVLRRAGGDDEEAAGLRKGGSLTSSTCSLPAVPQTGTRGRQET